MRAADLASIGGSLHRLSRERSRRRNVHAALSVGLPAIGVLIGAVQLTRGTVSLFDFGLLIAMYYLTGIGVEVGFHRLFSHRQFVAKPPLRYGLAILGAMAAEGPVIDWVATHRTHHRFSDQGGDPHSPCVGRDGAGRGGFWHAHVGWLFNHDTSEYFKLAPDLFNDPRLLSVNRRYHWWIALGLAIPPLVGFVHGGLAGAGHGFLWGGLIRMFAVQHSTFIANSLCHSIGSKDFRSGDQSRNVPWLRWFTLGASFHNTHHAFPRSACFAQAPGHWDPGWAVIRMFRAIGLVESVEQIDILEAKARGR